MALIDETTRLMLQHVAERARQAGVFAEVQREGQSLHCRARGTESAAFYRVIVDAGGVWVGLFTPDRWLSESIESDLVHHGDKIEELLEEELIEQGFEGRLPIEHFRDEARQYVFRSPVGPTKAAVGDASMAERVAAALLAYEAMFSQLGDMRVDDAIEG